MVSEVLKNGNIATYIMLMMTLIGWIFIFIKEKIEWWKALVPIYNSYCVFKRFYNIRAFIVMIICLILFIGSFIVECTSYIYLVAYNGKTAMTLFTISTAIIIISLGVSLVINFRLGYNIIKKYCSKCNEFIIIILTIMFVIINPIMVFSLGIYTALKKGNGE